MKKPSFETLLRDLTDEEPSPPPAPPKATKEEEKPFDDLLEELAGPEDTAPAEAETPALLSGLWRQTIADRIRQEVETKWNVPAGALDADELIVTLRIRLAQDGSVRRVEIVDAGEGANYRTMAESARRAVLQASPFRFLTEHVDTYEGWRNITMTFTPPV